MTTTTLTRDEAAYVRHYTAVIDAVCDCTAYVTPALNTAVETLEARIAPERIEALRDIARNNL